MSFLNFTFMMSWLALNVISVLFFFSWSSQITTLFLCCSYTNTITFVLYIISTMAMLVLRSCTFFFDRVLPESFCNISKPVLVAIAKYSWVWFEEIPFSILLSCYPNNPRSKTCYSYSTKPKQTFFKLLYHSFLQVARCACLVRWRLGRVSHVPVPVTCSWCPVDTLMSLALILILICFIIHHPQY